MITNQEKESLQSVFDEEGYEAVLNFLMRKDSSLTKEEAIEQASILGYDKYESADENTSPMEEEKTDGSEDSNLEEDGDSEIGSVDSSVEDNPSEGEIEENKEEERKENQE